MANVPTPRSDPVSTPASPDAANKTVEEIAKRVRNTVLVLMGVSGCGKTTIALELHRLLGWPFQEGDDLHPPANVEKMRSGQPLTDEDRWPWLARVAQWIADRAATGEAGIITCSNLKRAYRKVTVSGRDGVMLAYLRADEPLIAERLAQRHHPYMPVSSLHSQFEALEEPTADEHPIIVSAAGTVSETVADLLRQVIVAQQ